MLSAGFDRKRLRRWLAVFFLAFAVPTGLLIYQAYSQLKWEAFYQHRLLAEELSVRIDNRLQALIASEQIRSFADYSFLLVTGDESSNYLLRSPLAQLPFSNNTPGLIGYFQVDTEGVFSTPLLPEGNAAQFGIPISEFDQRLDIGARLKSILADNRLAAQGSRPPVDDVGLRDALDREEPMEEAATSAAASPQAAFDQLKQSSQPRSQSPQRARKSIEGNLGRVEELKLDELYQAKTETEHEVQEDSSADRPSRQIATANKRIQQEQAPQVAAPAGKATDLRITTFESEIDAFEFSMLDSGHFVLYRKVWRDGQRFVQGLLVEQQAFLRGIVGEQFRDTALAQMSKVIVAYNGEVFAAFEPVAPGTAGPDSGLADASRPDILGGLLYQTRMSAPFSDMQLIFSINRLPVGPGATVVAWLSVIMLLVLCGGFYLMYQLAGGQIDLTRQQQDFVSAVSHELKTPLTSIRMYGEMLREGWASEDKKASYYDYIFDESERLSRLIENVLQLARMTRNDLKIELRPVSIRELLDTIRSRITSQVERAGFVFSLDYGEDVIDREIAVDIDSFIQVIINLVDNALKFSADVQQRRIDILVKLLSSNSITFSVRDYGPGIEPDQLKKVFRLFYRMENELTRETVGTGIGLALVRQLCELMDARVDVVNREPGAEFTISFAVL